MREATQQRLGQVRTRIDQLLAEPQATVVEFQIRYDGLRKLEAVLTRALAVAERGPDRTLPVAP